MRISFAPAVLLAALAFGLPSAAPAHEEVFGKIKIGHPWVRASAEGAPGTYGCIIEIKNEGDVPEGRSASRPAFAGKARKSFCWGESCWVRIECLR